MLLYTYHAFRDGVAAAVGVLEQGVVQADARVAININCKKKALFLVFVLYLFCNSFSQNSVAKQNICSQIIR